MGKFLLKAWFSNREARLDARILVEGLGIPVKSLEYAVGDDEDDCDAQACLHIMLTLQDGVKYRGRELQSRLWEDTTGSNKRRKGAAKYNSLLLDDRQRIHRLEVLTSSKDTKRAFKAAEDRFRRKEIGYVLEAVDLSNPKNFTTALCSHSNIECPVNGASSVIIETIEESVAQRISDRVVSLLQGRLGPAAAQGPPLERETASLSKEDHSTTSETRITVEEELRAKVQIMSEENDALRAKVQIMSEEKETLKTEAQKTSEENETLKAKLATLSEQHTALNLNYTDAITHGVASNKEAAALRAEVQRLKDSLTRMTQCRDNLSKRLSKMEGAS